MLCLIFALTVMALVSFTYSVLSFSKKVTQMRRVH